MFMLPNRAKQTVKFVFFASKTIIPYSLLTSAYLIYSIDNVKSTHQIPISLPISLFCYPSEIENMKNAEYKLTISTNKPPIKVIELAAEIP